MSFAVPKDSPETMPVKPTQPPAAVTRTKKGIQERPEKAFERRRRIFFMSLALVVVAGLLFIFQHVTSPMDVSPMFGNSAKAPPARTPVPVAPTATAVVIVLPTRISLDTSATVVHGELSCFANVDTAADQGLIPADAQVQVTGYTAARGGMVQVYGQWFPSTNFRCSGDVRQLERPFILPGTPTRARSSGLAVVAPQPTVLAPTLAPVPIYTAVPAPTATPVTGIWWVGPTCWQVNLQGVREIYINGKGTSNGTYCGVNDFRVVIGGN